MYFIVPLQFVVFGGPPKFAFDLKNAHTNISHSPFLQSASYNTCVMFSVCVLCSL